MTMLKKTLVGLAASLVLTVSAFAQSNTVVATFATAPGAEKFSVALENKGPEQSIAGFAFKVSYDPAQVSFDSVANNTGQAASRASYVVGPVVEENGRAYRLVNMTTLKELTNAGKLAELKFTRKAAGKFVFGLDDRSKEPADGLQNAELKEVPHTFDVTAVDGAEL